MNLIKMVLQLKSMFINGFTSFDIQNKFRNIGQFLIVLLYQRKTSGLIRFFSVTGCQAKCFSYQIQL